MPVPAERTDRERLLRQCQRYLEVSGAAIVAFDRTARIELANATACRLLGRPAEQVLGADWISLAVPHGRRQTSRDALRAAMSGLRDVDPQYEHELVTATGERRLIEWTDVLIRDDDGTISGVLKSGIDITEQRAAQAAVEQAATDLEVLREIAHAVATLDDPRQNIVTGVRRLTGATIVTLVEPTADGVGLHVTATTSELVRDTVVRFGDARSAAIAAFESGEPRFLRDLVVDHEANPRLRGAMTLSSAVSHPVLVDGTPVGVLSVAWEQTVEELGARRAQLVAVGAAETAIALERAAGTDRLRAAALTDPLTGIANRRAFDQALADALGGARPGEPISVALMDMNGFKALNDCEGHEAGDALLVAASRAWQAELRPTDVLARIGGDEFAVVLRRCGNQHGHVVAQRLRSAIRHAAGCGVGIALWDGREDAAALVRRADQALYADKAACAAARVTDLGRLAAVSATGLLPGSRDPELDRVAATVAWLLDVQIGLVSLVTGDALVMAAIDGASFEAREAPVSSSFCQHTVALRRPLLIGDARVHPLVRDSPGIAEFGVLAYAGIPLIDDDGHALGSLCALDMQPRAWSPDDITVLDRLAAIARDRLVELQRLGRALPAVLRAA
jgi:diguanylate cyclase (GGDEF)-like protein/PAS domain S-box-containing protein